MMGVAGQAETLAVRTKRLLAEIGVRPRRERGQSFLIDHSVAQRIAELACGNNRPQVLEIGAGLGSLTEPLAQRASRLLAIELQPEFVQALRALFANQGHVTVVQADALLVDLCAMANGEPDQWRVAANLPYYAASAILLRCLQVVPPFGRIVAMVQREVGQRLCARPGDPQYGSLSVLAAYYASSVRGSLRVPRGAFYPQPKVDSLVLDIEPRRAPLVDRRDEPLLFAVIRTAFGQRRKQLVNSLSRAIAFGPIDRPRAEQALAAAGIAANARAEELDLPGFIALTSALRGSGVNVVEV